MHVDQCKHMYMSSANTACYCKLACATEAVVACYSKWSPATVAIQGDVVHEFILASYSLRL
jgi:hypothetical protein